MILQCYYPISFMLCNEQEFQILDLADAGAEPSLLFLAIEAQLLSFTKHFQMLFLLTRSVKGTFPKQFCYRLDHNKTYYL